MVTAARQQLSIKRCNSPRAQFLSRGLIFYGRLLSCFCYPNTLQSQHVRISDLRLYSHPQNIGSLYHRSQLFVLKQVIASFEVSKLLVQFSKAREQKFLNLCGQGLGYQFNVHASTISAEHLNLLLVCFMPRFDYVAYQRYSQENNAGGISQALSMMCGDHRLLRDICGSSN